MHGKFVQGCKAGKLAFGHTHGYVLLMIGNVSFSIFIFLFASLLSGILLPSRGICGEKLKGVSAGVSPYVVTEGDSVKGLAHDVMRAVSESAGFEYIPEKQTDKTVVAIPSCAEGQMMIAVASQEIAPCWERLGMVFTTDHIIIGLRKTPLRSLQDVRGKQVALIGESPFEASSGLNDVLLLRTEQFSDSLRLLVSGRVDYVVGSKLGLLWAARQMGAVSRALGVPLKLGRDEVYMYVSGDSVVAEERAALRDTLTVLKEKGVFLEIIRKYGL